METDQPQGIAEKRVGRTIPTHDARSLMLCVAGAWLYGTISAGRARELAKVLGHTAADIENLKFVEERNREAANNAR
jgi:hypothetical protein